MSMSILDEQHTDLGQFASNAGYSDLIKNACGAALNNMLDKGYTEHVPEVITDLHNLQLSCTDKDVCSTAKCLEQLLKGQEIAIISDGTNTLEDSTDKLLKNEKEVHGNRSVGDETKQKAPAAPTTKGNNTYINLEVVNPSTGDKLKAAAIDSVRKLFRAGGPGSGCHGPNCGKPKGTVSLKNSLRIPRSEMPQITKADLQDYVDWLKKQGIASHNETRDPGSLKPIQKTVNENVAKALPPDVNIPGRPMLISQDDYVLDGHHRLYRALLDNKQIYVCKIHTPMSKLLEITHQYPRVQYHTPHQTAKLHKVAAEGLL